MVHAQLAGHFKKNGISAEIVFLPDTKDVAQGLMSGELTAGQLIGPVFLAINAGAGPYAGKAVPLVTAQVGGTNGGVIVVRKDSSIKMPDDLKGKKIGVHNPLMVHHLLLKALLKKYNIDPGKDIQLKNINMSDLIPAMNKGEIDCFINPEPLGTFAVVNGAGTDLMVTRKMWMNHPCCVISMRKDFFEGNQQLAKSLYLSTLQSGLVLNNTATRQAAVQQIHKESAAYAKFPFSDLEKAFSMVRSDFDPFPYQSSGKALLNLMMEQNLMPKTVDAGKMVAQTFLSDFSRELLVSLGDQAPRNNNREERIMGQVYA
jgi:nitrate/nitrite transport system substrate-binding protein